MHGVVLTQDDYTSPSMGQAPPPEERGFSLGGGLFIDDTIAAMIAGANLVQWRWRVLASGTGTVTLTPGGESFLFLLYEAWWSLAIATAMGSTIALMSSRVRVRTAT